LCNNTGRFLHSRATKLWVWVHHQRSCPEQQEVWIDCFVLAVRWRDFCWCSGWAKFAFTEDFSVNSEWRLQTKLTGTRPVAIDKTVIEHLTKLPNSVVTQNSTVIKRIRMSKRRSQQYGEKESSVWDNCRTGFVASVDMKSSSRNQVRSRSWRRMVFDFPVVIWSWWMLWFNIVSRYSANTSTHSSFYSVNELSVWCLSKYRLSRKG
jgi:hypothetical protein